MLLLQQRLLPILRQSRLSQPNFGGGTVEAQPLLSDFLETRVKIKMGKGGKGSMTVDFAGLDDLERIYRRMTEARAAPPQSKAG